MVFSVKDNNILADRLTLTGSEAVFTGNVTLSGSAAPQLFLTSNTAGTPNYTLIANASSEFIIGRAGVSNDFTLNSGNATFAGKIIAGVGASAQATINAFSTTVSTNLYSALRVIDNTSASSYWDIGATGGSSTLLNFYHNSNTTPKISFTHLGGATFAGDVIAPSVASTDTSGRYFMIQNAAGNQTYPVYSFRTDGNTGMMNPGADILSLVTGGTTRLTINNSSATFASQAFATTATSSGDASSTLTTKGYVDSLITGATIYRGTWNPDKTQNSGYGVPNLSTVTQTSGYYYICSAVGIAEPNGAGCEPNSWACRRLGYME